MKVCLILVALAAACSAQPAQPQGFRPSGRVLLLPARVEEEPSTPAPQANSTQSDEKESAQILDSGEYYVLLEDGRLQMVKYTTAALKEQDEKSAGQPKNQQYKQPQQNTQYQNNQQYQQNQQYYQNQQNQQNQQFKQPQQPQYPVYQQPQQYQPPQKYQQPQQSQQYRNPSPAESSVSSQQANPEPFAQFQLEYVQFPLPGSQYTQTKLAYTAPEPEAEADSDEKEDAEEPAGYQANVQYRDVKPISAPIYAYNPAPLVRILKK